MPSMPEKANIGVFVVAYNAESTIANVLARIPEFERDITGLPMIERMADVMFGGK